MKTYLKRMSAPRTWPISRRQGTWIVRPKPKGQALELTMPIAVVLRDILKIVETTAHVRKVLKAQTITVNGRRIHGISDAVGFMDIVGIDKSLYRILINRKNQLTVTPVKKGEDVNLEKINGKTTIRGGVAQLNFASGRNLRVEKDSYKVGDSVVVQEGKITQHLPMQKGASVLINGGSHIGNVGQVTEIAGQVLTVTSGKNEYSTTKAYAYVVGADKPIITL